MQNAYVYLYNLNDSARYSFISSQSMSMDTGNNGLMTYGGGLYKATETINAIQIFPYSGTFSLTANLYGVKKIWVV